MAPKKRLSSPTSVRMAPKKKLSSPSPISFGNCKVEIDADNYSCDSNAENLVISVPSGAKIKILKDDGHEHSQQDRERRRFPLENYIFALVDPKGEEDSPKSLLEEILNLYMAQLPTMNYASNTGKKSRFLENCISSGKYRTLAVRLNCAKGPGKVIAAVSYQIIPSDTRYAEVPLAAVCSNYQNRGIGSFMYKELKERLQHVGISTVLCWADNISEGFWCKQGFVSIGKVNRKGKACRLPIKADIRKALCFPGGSTLMISHITAHNVNSTDHDNTNSSTKFSVKSKSLKSGETRGKGNSISLNKNYSIQDKHVMEDCYAIDSNESNGKKRIIWEAPLSSLISKRIRCGHKAAGCPNIHLDPPCKKLGAALKKCSSETPKSITHENITSGNPTNHITEGVIPDSSNEELAKGICPQIMFMNIADDDKRACLTKIVEKLGGSVTYDGKSCTHVITGQARRTLNFCIALCSGAWIVSPQWLKASFREGKFLDESSFILGDLEYLTKYQSELKDAVTKAKANPHSLLKGYDICIAKHILPSANVLSSIIGSAGGNVVRRVESIKEPSKTIYLACEEDMEDAMSVAYTGVPIFIIAAVWFVVFALVMLCGCFYHCCCSTGKYSYSPFAYGLSLVLLIIFTLSAMYRYFRGLGS